ncbi:uncharacterized protein LOC124708980 [Lolium rigidum]|uniref:uncharacterized protein LOC124708980 n=1 Tax=Lolium rigidum TaxID=89674 RepID=UPI001F5D8740|nr:uncharacterized protein LOC124708980 [Lolium rigidum]
MQLICDVIQVIFVLAKQTVKLDLESIETMHEKEATNTACHEDASADKSNSDEYDPWNPPYPPFVPPVGADPSTAISLSFEWTDEKDAELGAHRASSIIFPDRTPQTVNLAFHDTLHRLVPILDKDSVRGFLRFMQRYGRGTRWGFIITPEALNQMITQNALRCVKVALEGQAPELGRCRAGPNVMTQYGYFPLHRAAEMFSVDMIELLIRHGASANLRTAGAEVIEGLLPLHVAVDNTCMHKYLEDSLFPNREDQDYNEHRDCSEADANYIFRLIYLLCLPEMKIFLDTTRLVAKYTDNLLVELWNYIKDGKLAQTAILLLAAQQQIRMGTSRKKKGNSKPDGFPTICERILDNNITLQLEKGQNGIEQEQVDAKIKLNHTAMMLVRVISKAGEDLDSYIRNHLEVPYFMQVPHLEVLERVSSILKDNGFCPTRECIDTGNLFPYHDVLSSTDIPSKPGERASTRESLEMDYLSTVKDKATRKRKPRRWELKFARRSFFPWWRSVLSARSPVKVVPSRWVRPTKDLDCEKALKKPISDLDREIISKKATTHGSAAPMGRAPQVGSYHQHRMLCGTAVGYQPRRLFGTTALALLKVLKKA